MNVLVITDEKLKEELCSGGINPVIHIEWRSGLPQPGGEVAFETIIDLLFDGSKERIELLQQLEAPLVIINAVTLTSEEIGPGFVRINGWTTFLKRPVVEAACRNDALKEKAEPFFSMLGKKPEWVPDIAGFVTARVVASVINEAYFALEEQVSSKEEIDIAMKLGTNYPYGPFEWAEKIGLKKVHALLEQLGRQQKRYVPATLLTKEAKA